jgi:arylsulfatase A-like enzyme
VDEPELCLERLNHPQWTPRREGGLSRRTFLGGALGTAAAVAGPGLSWLGCNGEATPAERPNLLFVLADQWRFCAFGDGEDGGPATPHMLQLASQGTRFTRSYAANPVCAPSRASLITGRHAHLHRVIDNDLMLPPDEPGLAEAFDRAGYATHYIGKWHLDGPAKPGFVPPGWRRRGFRTFEGFNRGHRYTDPISFANDGSVVRPEKLEYEYQTDRALDFLRGARSRPEQPFFCFLSWGPPHQPEPPARLSNPERFASRPAPWRLNVPPRLRENPNLRAYLGGYYDLCEALDREMGRLLAGLDELGLADDTLVVFSSDHGDMIGSHGLRWKKHPFEESLGVPLMLRWPGRIPAGRYTKALASGVDLLPTLHGLCGLETPASCSGRDLSQVARGGDEARDASVYAAGRMTDGPEREWRALVTQRYKLVIRAPWRASHLYDLEHDPFERTNLVDEPGHAKTRDELLARAREWKERTRDPFPKPSPRARESYADAETTQA